MTSYLNRGVFETAHGIGENIRGRTLGAIDDMTKSGTPGTTSHYTSMADRGRVETERGMAHIYGDPSPNQGRVFHNEPDRMPQPTFGGSHTTGTGPGTGLAEQVYYGRGDVGRGSGKEAGGYGMPHDGGGAQNLEQQPAIDRNMEMGPNTDPRRGSLSPNRRHQSAGPGEGWSPTSQAEEITPAQQGVRRDFPPELPPRPQAQTTDNGQHGQIYQ